MEKGMKAHRAWVPTRGTQGLGAHHSLLGRPPSLVAVRGSRTSGQSHETRGWGLPGRPGTAARSALWARLSPLTYMDAMRAFLSL